MDKKIMNSQKGLICIFCDSDSGQRWAKISTPFSSS